MAEEAQEVDGTTPIEETVLEQQETPKEEQPTSTRNDDGDVAINLGTATTPTEEEPVREAILGEVHQPEEVVEPPKPEEDETSKPALERVEDGDESPTTAPQQKEVPASAEASQLPENVEKLLSFLNDTPGATVEDYVSLNKDISKLDDLDVVKEYYRQKNPRMSEERLTRKLDKDFLFDEDLDEEDIIQDKKDLFEDELYDARKFLEERKETYYTDLKSNAVKALPPETQEAVHFYNEQKKTAETQSKLNTTFLERTDKLFNEDFKGFDFKLGDNGKFRVNVDSTKVKENQKDLNNFIAKFVGEDGTLTDAAGYHKAMYVAENVDDIANHFYEQGRADAIKQGAKEAKNINMGGRSDMGSTPRGKGGITVRPVPEPQQMGFKVKK